MYISSVWVVDDLPTQVSHHHARHTKYFKNETLNHHPVCATKKEKFDHRTRARGTRMRPQIRPFARAPARLTRPAPPCSLA
eukprot:1020724-Prymnesium_polylepis.1